jgi:hypothetical protein
VPERMFDVLVTFEPTDLPVLSVYLDMRPQATGENPALRPGLVLLKDRLNEIEKTLGARGPARDSFRADAARIQAFLENETNTETQGLAIFACSGRGLFETVGAGVPFEDHVGVSRVPDLSQLARLLDDQETALLAVVDTNTARLFVTRYGHLDEVNGPNDKNTKLYRKRSMGGWKQMHYQRNIDNNRIAFQKRVADAIDQLMVQTDAVRLVLAGDEVAIPLLKDTLSNQAVQCLHEETITNRGLTVPEDQRVSFLTRPQ